MKEIIPVPIREAYRFMRAKFLSIGLSNSGYFDQSDKEIVASKDFSIIVPIRDAPEITARCLNSLENYCANAEVILVNDASKLEETISLIDNVQRQNGWQVVNHDKSLGHSRSCEEGSILSNGKYLCLLNSDTIVTPCSWYAAKEAFEFDPKIAVSGPSTSRAATKQAIRRAEYCRNYWSDEQICTFAKKYISKQPPRSWIDLPDVGGFAFFIRRSIWEEFGGFNSLLPDYGNETELCMRLSERGYRLVWTRNSYIHHFGRRTYGKILNQQQIQDRCQAGWQLATNLHQKKVRPSSE